MSEEKLRSALDQARDSGIRDIMALRGDSPRGDRGTEPSFIESSIDLIRWIKKNYGNTFKHPFSATLDFESTLERMTQQATEITVEDAWRS